MTSVNQYLTDEYRGKLSELVEDNPSISEQEAEARFIQKCEEMKEFLKEGTPVSVIRHLSFNSIESSL